jgi:hypothetical protein
MLCIIQLSLRPFWSFDMILYSFLDVDIMKRWEKVTLVVAITVSVIGIASGFWLRFAAKRAFRDMHGYTSEYDRLGLIDYQFDTTFIDIAFVLGAIGIAYIVSWFVVRVLIKLKPVYSFCVIFIGTLVFVTGIMLYANFSQLSSEQEYLNKALKKWLTNDSVENDYENPLYWLPKGENQVLSIENGVLHMLSALQHRKDKTSIRDYAILQLRWNLGLSRESITLLDVKDFQLYDCTILVREKGNSEKSTRSLTDNVCEGLTAWVYTHGYSQGPLFINIDRADKVNERLTPECISDITQNAGELAGLQLELIRSISIWDFEMREMELSRMVNDSRFYSSYYDEEASRFGRMALVGVLFAIYGLVGLIIHPK